MISLQTTFHISSGLLFTEIESESREYLRFVTLLFHLYINCVDEIIY
jgi:hypothetical protein